MFGIYQVLVLLIVYLLHLQKAEITSSGNFAHSGGE